MAGAWELMKQKSVLCVILHTDMTTMAWSLGLRNLVIPGGVMPLAGAPFDQARNTGAMRALETGTDFLFFLDSDVIPPRDAIMRLLAHDKPIVGGLYFRRSPPAGVPVMQRPLGQWITQYPKNALVDVDVVGTGCLLIRRDVLEKMKPQRPGHHWFWWACDHPRELLTEGEAQTSEDFSFCLAAKRQGWPVLVDTSVVCRHVGLAEAGYGTFSPVNVIPEG